MKRTDVEGISRGAALDHLGLSWDHGMDRSDLHNGGQWKLATVGPRYVKAR